MNNRSPGQFTEARAACYFSCTNTLCSELLLSPGGSDSKESAYSAGDPGSTPGSGRSPGGGNGDPLQYSCLENPLGEGAWWATYHGVARSRKRLSDFSFAFPCCSSRAKRLICSLSGRLSPFGGEVRWLQRSHSEVSVSSQSRCAGRAFCLHRCAQTLESLSNSSPVWFTASFQSFD